MRTFSCDEDGEDQDRDDDGPPEIRSENLPLWILEGDGVGYVRRNLALGFLSLTLLARTSAGEDKGE